MHHIEEHFTGGDIVRDVVIGMADGLTVPFALAAGISGALASTHIVVTAGVAEIAAGAIAMGLGGYFEAVQELPEPHEFQATVNHRAYCRNRASIVKTSIRTQIPRTQFDS